MTCRNILRTTLVAIAILTLVAAPAVAATAAERPADVSDRTAWSLEVSNLLSRAWGLLFGERLGEQPVDAVQRGGDQTGEIKSVSASDESDSGSSMDPNG